MFALDLYSEHLVCLDFSVLSLSRLMEKAMAPHSSTLAWKIPWTEEPGGLQSMGFQRVGHDWATSLSCIGEGNGNPLQCSCLENPMDRGAWWAAVYGVTQSRTWLKRLSSSSSMNICACRREDTFLRTTQMTPLTGLYRLCMRFIYLLLAFINFYWSTLALQWRVSFYGTAKWIS